MDQLRPEDHDFWENLNGAMEAFGEILAGLPIPISLEGIRSGDPSSSAVAVKLQALLLDQPVPAVPRAALENWVDAWFASHVLGAQVQASPDPLVASASWSAYLMFQAMMLHGLDYLRDWQAGRIPAEDLEG